MIYNLFKRSDEYFLSCIILLILLFGSIASSAQSTIRGRVIHEDGLNRGIKDVKVWIKNLKDTVLTDSDGFFTIVSNITFSDRHPPRINAAKNGFFRSYNYRGGIFPTLFDDCLGYYGTTSTLQITLSQGFEQREKFIDYNKYLLTNFDSIPLSKDYPQYVKYKHAGARHLGKHLGVTSKKEQKRLSKIGLILQEKRVWNMDFSLTSKALLDSHNFLLSGNITKVRIHLEKENGKEENQIKIAYEQKYLARFASYFEAYEKASRYYEKAIDLAPVKEKYYIEYIDFLVSIGQNKQAKKQHFQATRNIKSLFAKGLLMLEYQRYFDDKDKKRVIQEAAVEIICEAIKEQPQLYIDLFIPTYFNHRTTRINPKMSYDIKTFKINTYDTLTQTEPERYGFQLVDAWKERASYFQQIVERPRYADMIEYNVNEAANYVKLWEKSLQKIVDAYGKIIKLAKRGNNTSLLLKALNKLGSFYEEREESGKALQTYESLQRVYMSKYFELGTVDKEKYRSIEDRIEALKERL